MNKLALPVMLSLGLTACGTMTEVSQDGMAKSEIKWPDVTEFIAGSTPPKHAVREIKTGLNKQDIYQLVGAPHFSEGFNVAEWDYLFHTEDKGVKKSCQFKILFDSNKVARSFYWRQPECAGYFAQTK
ncbi:putative lipoprotein [Taylorella asinigenitalis 14/45]|uniref:Outer membrane protein A n=2 Tax=Taylorella asinigenitalis TaxID=84590 RepID=G4QD35_TAYAM|nr:outer membrane protein assembly factor BamE [Taylorella asinigenitalis]AEP35852.1 Outer membrane protein A precursor [Taylorella asinigenitalis MCE3]CCG19754.1 putative lipoprotein [Taylorella asinigenitalis 14/45]